MLFKVTPDNIAALRRAVDVLDAVDEGSLVEITTGPRFAFTVCQITTPEGCAPVTADEVFVASFGPTGKAPR